MRLLKRRICKFLNSNTVVKVIHFQVQTSHLGKIQTQFQMWKPNMQTNFNISTGIDQRGKKKTQGMANPRLIAEQAFPIQYLLNYIQKQVPLSSASAISSKRAATVSLKFTNQQQTIYPACVDHKLFKQFHFLGWQQGYAKIRVAKLEQKNDYYMMTITEKIQHLAKSALISSSLKEKICVKKMIAKQHTQCKLQLYGFSSLHLPKCTSLNTSRERNQSHVSMQYATAQ